MSQLTKNFSRAELECGCGCGACDMSKLFLDCLQKVRDDVGVPLHVNSGFRCEKHNAAVGGSKRSFHLRGLAADIRCRKSGDRYKLVKAAMAVGFTGVLIYDDFVHLDLRSVPKLIKY